MALIWRKPFVINTLRLVHPTRFERVASAFGGQRSIQLSYGCLMVDICEQLRRFNRLISAFYGASARGHGGPQGLIARARGARDHKSFRFGADKHLTIRQIGL